MKEQILSALRGAQSIVVTTHISPDADAIGSSFALARICRSLGKEVSVYLADPVPLRVLPLIGDTPFEYELPSDHRELLVVIDVATKNRVGPKVEELFQKAAKSVVIDHHISNPGFGDINYIVGEAPSSCSLVLEIAESLGAPLDPTTVDLLFAGLTDDTGSFRYSNSSPRAFQEASRLVALGARVEQISQTLFFSVPMKRMRLRARALETLKLICDGRIAFASVSSAVLAAEGCTSEDTDGLIDDVRSIEGTVGAVFVREIDGAWKASLRSKGDLLDVNTVASSFGGGGHRAAAGCTVRETDVARVEALLGEAIVRVLGR